MKLWHLSQTVNNGYDTYDSCIVVAERKEDAILIHPNAYSKWNGGCWITEPDWKDDTWAPPECLKVEEIGTARDGIKGVQCASFNAG